MIDVEFMIIYDDFLKDQDEWFRNHKIKDMRILVKAMEYGSESVKHKANWMYNKLETFVRVRNWACQ